MNMNEPCLPLHPSRRRGYGILELMIGLALVAMLTAGAVHTFRQMRDQQTAESQVLQLTQIIQALQKTYGMVGYSGLTSCGVTPYVVPTELWDPSNTCTTAPDRSARTLTGGPITFTPINSGANMEIVFGHIPSSQCPYIVAGLQNLADKIDVSGELRTGTPTPTSQPVYKNVKASGLPVAADAMAEWCTKEELQSGGASPTSMVQNVSWVNIKFTITR